MAQKIDFKKAEKVNNPIIIEEKVVEESGNIQEIMDKKYPDKLLFDIKTVSAELNCSYEVIRLRAANGTIKCIKIGVSKMIPRSEFIKLLTVGV